MANIVSSRLTMLSVTVSILIVISFMAGQANCGLDSLFSDNAKFKEKECINSFSKLKNIEQLGRFLANLHDQLAVGQIIERDASRCLRSNGNVRSEIRAFKSLILAATKGEICRKENVEKLVLMHPKLTINFRENREKRLAPMWEQFVREVIVTCKRSLVDKLSYESRQSNKQDYLKDVLNLAQNFNWFDTQNFLPTGPLKMSSKMIFKSLDDVAHLVPTSSKIEELSRVKNIPDFVGDGANQPSYDFVLTREQFYRMQEMFSGCSYLLQDEILDPILDLASLDYNDSETGLDNQISEYRHIDIWLATGQMCHLLNYVQVLIMSENGDSYHMRFKAGKHYERDERTESNAHVVHKDFRNIENNIHMMLAQVKYWKKLDKFTNIESTVKSIHWNGDVEHDKLKLLNEESSNLQKALFSQRFLEVVAKFVQETDGFSPIETY